jgi:hypothetical protein
MIRGAFRAVFATVAIASVITALPVKSQVSSARQVLQPIDSVRVEETAALQVSRVGEVAVSITRTFIADPAEWRVLEVSRTGKIVRAFGRRGQGPGEFETPGSLVVAGDELMVMDFSLRRISVFSLVSGKLVRTFPLNAFLPSLVFRGDELYAAAFDVTSKTSVVRLSPKGELIGREGVIPAIAQRFPALLDPFPHQGLAVEPTSVHMVSELANSLYSWPRGGGRITETRIPTLRRRGANDAKFEQMVREPQKAGAIAYDHTVPVALSLLADRVLGMVSYDPVVKQGRFSGQYHLTVIDLASRRACPDVPLPVPADPLARVAIESSRVTVVQQSESGGDAVTTIRRFRVNTAACAWVALP